MLEALPDDILRHVLNFTNYQDIAAINRVSKKLCAKTALTLKELKEIYHSLAGKSSNEIVGTCLNSLKATQAVMMSKLLFELNSEQIISIACTSYDHAKAILQSHFMQRGIRYPVNPKKGQLHATKEVVEDNLESDIGGKQSLQGADRLTYGEIISSLNEIDVSISSDNIDSFFIKQGFYKKSNLSTIIETLAKKDDRYASLVLIYAGELLSGYKLMEMAKRNLDHAKLILGSVTLRNRLKEGHVIGIAKTSLEHAKYILTYHFTRIGPDGIKQLGAINAEYTALVTHRLITILSNLPIKMITAKPELTKSITLALLKDTFYSSSNNAWSVFRDKNPENAKQILAAFKAVTFLKANSIINNFIIIKIIKLSIAHAKEILSLPTIEKRLGQVELKKLASINEAYAELINNIREQNTTSVPTKAYGH